MIQSPLNYTGGKYKLLPQIMAHFPKDISCFVDLFCGGCNVGINVPAERILYNDNCEPLINLYHVMQKLDCDVFLNKVEQLIAKYNLSDVKKNGYDFYDCKSSDGLGSYNKEFYLNLRSDFNKITYKNDDYYIMLYVLIVFSFNNQIRFNKNGEFNLPVGKRDFNQKMYSKVIDFITIIKQQKALFTCRDFRNISIESLSPNDFVYADPPYLITCASYNERDGWNENDEEKLLDFLDKLTNRGIRFALSNVLESKGKENLLLKNWLQNRPTYKVFELNYTYNNSNYHRINKENKTKEILVINY